MPTPICRATIRNTVLATLGAACLALMITGLTISGAMAEDDDRIAIGIDEARLVTATERPASIIVGNPSIADVMIQRGMIVLLGKAYGTTNILMLDGDGRTLADMRVTVIANSEDRVSLYRGGPRDSYICGVTCEPELKIGDRSDHFNRAQQQIVIKSGLATGSGRDASSAE